MGFVIALLLLGCLVFLSLGPAILIKDWTDEVKCEREYNVYDCTKHTFYVPTEQGHSPSVTLPKP